MNSIQFVPSSQWAPTYVSEIGSHTIPDQISKSGQEKLWLSSDTEQEKMDDVTQEGNKDCLVVEMCCVVIKLDETVQVWN